MIRRLPLDESHIVAFEVGGKLTEKDYKTFTPDLEELIEEIKPLSLLVVLKDFEGWSAKAAWQDFKLGQEIDDDLLRLAIVGNSLTEKLMSKFGSLFMDTELEYFESKSRALEWLKETEIASGNSNYKHILVASDFSKYADLALQRAVNIAKPFGAKISLIHIAENISAELYPSLGELAVPVMIDNPDLDKKHLELIKNDLEAVVKRLKLSNENIVIEVMTGSPVDNITGYATTHNVDLIVMGSHSRHGLARLLGSSTNGVISHAPCDILTVVAKDH